MNQPVLAFSNEIRSAVLKSSQQNFSEDAFKNLKGDNKELMIIDGAGQVDLYDNYDKIPFDKMEKFFKTYLK